MLISCGHGQQLFSKPCIHGLAEVLVLAIVNPAPVQARALLSDMAAKQVKSKDTMVGGRGVRGDVALHDVRQQWFCHIEPV